VNEAALADLIATAVQTCPAVAWLHGGRFGQATTYLPGRRITGVAVSPGEIVVGVVGRYPASVFELDAQVRAAVAAVAPGVPVTVHIEDLALPGENPAVPATDPPKAPSAAATGARPRGAGPAPVPPHPPAASPLPRPWEKERPS
jgi:hypothetical protein